MERSRRAAEGFPRVGWLGEPPQLQVLGNRSRAPSSLWRAGTRSFQREFPGGTRRRTGRNLWRGRWI